MIRFKDGSTSYTFPLILLQAKAVSCLKLKNLFLHSLFPLILLQAKAVSFVNGVKVESSAQNRFH